MASICLCMIAKDEERHIERCIKSVQGLVDEIVVADTGSTDATIEIVERLGGRVYSYQWDDSFANARNFAIKKAESEWLLLLDADEALDASSLDVVAEFVRTTALDGAHFRIRNYTGVYVPDNYSLHSGLRLLRNNGRYHYRGDIHEQITTDGGENISARFAELEVVVHHYGYLTEVIQEKQKRRRNIPILEKQLTQDPDEPFTLFNMGNEYLSMQDYQAALGYYEQALQKLVKRNLAFVPHLFFRMIGCYESLRDYEKALRAAQMGLEQFPGCTDYEFRRAELLHRLGRYTLAIESFEKCLKMGRPHMQLEFLPGCGDYRAAYGLGEVYLALEDYSRAVHYFELALSHKADLYAALYRLGKAFNRLYADKGQVLRKLLAYFANPAHTPNALLAADILTGEELYEQALESLTALTGSEGYESELLYLKARIFCYEQRFTEAAPLLEAVCSAPEPSTRVLPGVRPGAALLLFATGLVEDAQERLDAALHHIQALCSAPEHRAAELMRALFAGEAPDDPHYENEGRQELTAILRLLDVFLKCRALELFEQMLYALNYVDSRDILLRLAQLYEQNGLLPLAAEHVLRSIRELDILDAAGAGILFRAYRR